MVYNESKKQGNIRWDKQNMVNVSCRITIKKKERFQNACKTLNTSMYSVLLKAVDETIAKAEKGDD